MQSHSSSTWQVMGLRYIMTLLGYRINYKLSYRQQIKVQVLILLILSLKASIWALFTFFSPKNENTITKTLIIPWTLVVPMEVKIICSTESMVFYLENLYQYVFAMTGDIFCNTQHLSFLVLNATPEVVKAQAVARQAMGFAAPVSMAKTNDK